MSKRFIMAAVVACVAAMSAAASSASAAVSCTELTAQTDYLAPPIQLIGGTGSYSLQGQGLCSVNGGPLVQSFMTSSGSYTNVVCGGSMAWVGSASVSNGTSGSAGFTYQIQFNGGVGQLTMNGGSAGEGIVVARPSQQSQPGGSNCITQFDLTGWFAGT